VPSLLAHDPHPRARPEVRRVRREGGRVTVLPKFHHLTPPHVAELVRSGLGVETISLCGFFSGSKEEVAEILGYGGAGTGLVIPYSQNGFKRVKLDSVGSDGKAYRSPRRAGNHLYIPKVFPGGADALGDVSVMLAITEGEKKTAKACQEGLHCIGLGGVWSFVDKQSRITLPIKDLELIPWDGREVVVIFDSDSTTNPKVERAEAELGQELTRRRGSCWGYPASTRATATSPG
jgi:hypothetical protein